MAWGSVLWCLVLFASLSIQQTIQGYIYQELNTLLTIANERFGQIPIEPAGPAYDITNLLSSALVTSQALVEFSQDTLPTLIAQADNSTAFNWYVANVTLPELQMLSSEYLNKSGNSSELSADFNKTMDLYLSEYGSASNTTESLVLTLSAWTSFTDFAQPLWSQVHAQCAAFPAQSEIETEIGWDKGNLSTCSNATTCNFWKSQLYNDTQTLNAVVICNSFLNITYDLIAAFDSVFWYTVNSRASAHLVSGIMANCYDNQVQYGQINNTVYSVITTANIKQSQIAAGDMQTLSHNLQV
eukprot:Phypoly_transcript_03654.p1 GENE.Phypoly_transcript_03654~~Phypoly_transcript_03654.p1  ORF type:complete len:299 (+),score=24.61 Phypoly_transcript_03654:1452-2348(+)